MLRNGLSKFIAKSGVNFTNLLVLSADAPAVFIYAIQFHQHNYANFTSKHNWKLHPTLMPYGFCNMPKRTAHIYWG